MNDVQFVYNSFGQLVAEYQEHGGAVNVSTTPKVQYAYADGSANHVRRTSMTYPNGRILRYEYSSGADDNLGRVSFLADDNAGAVGTHLAAYTSLGLGDVMEVDYTEATIRYDLAGGSGDDPYDGLDRFDRVVDCLWRNYGTSTDVERIKYGYDRASNRLWRENTVAPAGFDELYSYDGLYQLKDFERGDLNAGKTAITGLGFAQEWSLDATDNWTAFKEDADGNGGWDLNQSRAHNKVNEISTIGASAGTDWVDPVHDRAGNMVVIPQPADPAMSDTATWDAWNRLTRVVRGQGTISAYAYDALARRSYKVLAGETRHFFYTESWQVLEERVDASQNADRDFVWGLRHLDDLIQRARDLNGNEVFDEFLYAMQDSQWNITALTAPSSPLSERFQYSPFGSATAMSGTFETRQLSTYDWETYKHGCRLDSETGFYHLRLRFLQPRLGRFLTRDPIGYIFGANLVAYVSNNPINASDPTGAAAIPVDPNCRDVCGPDVTDWFCKDIVAHLQYAGKNRGARKFRNQAANLMAHKWMDFSPGGQCGTGKCVNTVELAGVCIRKNQLGNIVFMVVGTRFPPWRKGLKGAGLGASSTEVAKRGYGRGDSYRRTHRWAFRFGQYAGQRRRDNLAAFGVGAALGTSIGKFTNKEQCRDGMAKALNAPDALNRFSGLHPDNPELTVDDLTFVPEFGGFNTRSCQPCPYSLANSMLSSIEAGRAIQREHAMRRRLGANTLMGPGPGLDEYREERYEDYAHAAGYSE